MLNQLASLTALNKALGECISRFAGNVLECNGMSHHIVLNPWNITNRKQLGEIEKKIEECIKTLLNRYKYYRQVAISYIGKLYPLSKYDVPDNIIVKLIN